MISKCLAAIALRNKTGAQGHNSVFKCIIMLFVQVYKKIWITTTIYYNFDIEVFRHKIKLQK